MDRIALFVDAGYLLASGGSLVCGSRRRNSFRVDFSSLLEELAENVTGIGGNRRHLRTYWYDGARDGVPTLQHEEIGSLPYVKVRLGRVIENKQKGVDSLIYRDLMTLARERAITEAFLLSGDEDLREGVIAAQDLGVQVVLLGVPPTGRSNQSHSLIREADDHILLPVSFWGRFFVPLAAGEPHTEATATLKDATVAAREFADRWLTKVSRDALANLRDSDPIIPPGLDIELIHSVESKLGHLDQRQDLKKAMRAGFWESIRLALIERG